MVVVSYLGSVPAWIRWLAGFDIGFDFHGHGLLPDRKAIGMPSVVILPGEPASGSFGLGYYRERGFPAHDKAERPLSVQIGAL